MMQGKRTVLDKMTHRGDTVLFEQDLEEIADEPDAPPPITVVMPTEDWREFNKPSAITIGIVPGDSLNDRTPTNVVIEYTNEGREAAAKRFKHEGA